VPSEWTDQAESSPFDFLDPHPLDLRGLTGLVELIENLKQKNEKSA